MKTITNRQIMLDAQELVLKDSKLKVYIKEDNDKWICQIFEGRKTKPSTYTRFRSFENMENEIKNYIRKEQSDIKYKANLKASRAEKLKNFKRDLIPGVTVRASFSYNMTFNYFYRVISNKGNTYKFEILEKEWADGNIGYTGSVKAGRPTGKFIEGKLTQTGLKIDNLNASICNPSSTFYENHLD